MATGDKKVPAPPYEAGKVPYPLPHAARAKMVAWLAIWHDVKHKGPSTADLAHLSNNDLSAIYLTFVNEWHNTKGGTVDPSVGPIEDNPITGPFASVAEAVTALITSLFDPAFWLRIAEVGIGAILIGVGLAKLTSLGPTLSKVPVYGKMIP